MGVTAEHAVAPATVLADFLVQWLKDHAHKVIWPGCSAVDLLVSGDALNQWIKSCRPYGRKTPREHAELLQDLCNVHLTHAQLTNVHVLPKHHLFKHASSEAEFKGNPARYAVWLDESLNHIIACICASTHHSAMVRKAFVKFDRVLEGERVQSSKLFFSKCGFQCPRVLTG